MLFWLHVVAMVSVMRENLFEHAIAVLLQTVLIALHSS